MSPNQRKHSLAGGPTTPRKVPKEISFDPDNVPTDVLRREYSIMKLLTAAYDSLDEDEDVGTASGCTDRVTLRLFDPSNTDIAVHDPNFVDSISLKTFILKANIAEQFIREESRDTGRAIDCFKDDLDAIEEARERAPKLLPLLRKGHRLSDIRKILFMGLASAARVEAEDRELESYRSVRRRLEF